MITKENEKMIKEEVKDSFDNLDLKEPLKISNAERERQQKKELVYYKNDGNGNPIYLTRKQIRKMESGMK